MWRYSRCFSKQWVAVGRLRRFILLDQSQHVILRCNIELNPVRSGMVEHASEYRWSSYGFNALGQTNNLMTPHHEYRCLGNNDKERRNVYQQLFEQHIPEESINAIREATNKAWVLGDERFKRGIREQLKRQVKPAARGGDRKSVQDQSSLTP